MKICYIGDNRNRTNWGCRATSIALKQLLLEKNEVISVITGEYTLSKMFNVVFSDNYTVSECQDIIRKNFLNYENDGKKIKELGIKQDFRCEDIDLTLKIFLEIYNDYENLKQIYESIYKADTVIINGEGTFIFTTPARLDTITYLFFIKLSYYLNKKVYVVNTMFSLPPEGDTNIDMLKITLEIFKECDVSFRENTSYKTALQFSEYERNNFTVIPDALFSWYDLIEKVDKVRNGDMIIPFPEQDYFFNKMDFSDRYVCISGGSLAAWHPAQAIPQYVKLVNKLKELKINLYLTPTCDGDRFLTEVSKQTGITLLPKQMPIVAGAKILSEADVFISGRYHPSIMASLGGTPCIFMKANSHKSLSLQYLLNYKMPKEYNAIPTDGDIENIYSDCKTYLLKDSLRKKIKHRSCELAKKSKSIVEYIN